MSLEVSETEVSKEGGIPEWPNGADCKSVVLDFGGSNPPLPTNDISGSSSFGRAIAFQAIGGRFEPGLPLGEFRLADLVKQ